ncbi:MAG: Maf family protein [Atopobiaceae bacterium]|jgi:septum formation protein
MILASASPRRKELLQRAGYDITIIPADVDETHQAGEKPRALVSRLAEMKAHAVWAKSSGRESLLAADTIVWTDDGTILGKPQGVAGAAAMLEALSGKTHHVSTGVCLMVPAADTPRELTFCDTTDVTFFELSADEIAAYIATGEPMDKAGAYGIQGAASLFVKKIDGAWDNVVGLPMAHVVRELARLEQQAGAVTHTLPALLAHLARKGQEPA